VSVIVARINNREAESSPKYVHLNLVILWKQWPPLPDLATQQVWEESELPRKSASISLAYA